MLGFSGWLAAAFLLGFLTAIIGSLLEDEGARLMIGAGMVAAAYWLLRRTSNDFLVQTGLAVSLAGQALVGWFLFDVIDDWQTATAALAVFEGVLAVVMPNFVHRVFSAFVAAASLSIVLLDTSLRSLAVPLLFALSVAICLNEFRLPAHVRRLQSVGYGVILALVFLKMGFVFGQAAPLAERGFVAELPWLDEFLNGVILLFVVWRLLVRRGLAATSPAGIAAIGGALALSGVSLYASGLSVGLAVLLLGFAGGNRVLFGIGIAALLSYVASYYYLLDTTLLVKSASLFAVGVVLLACRFAMLRLTGGGARDA